jgi:hypothetical protein
MSNVKIPFGDDPRETALFLLAAAEDADLDRRIVRTDGEGHFLAPREIAEAAGLDYESDDDEDDSESEEQPKKAAKKTAKKTAKKSS